MGCIVYFVFLIVFGSFFMLNLIVAVILESYNEASDSKEVLVVLEEVMLLLSHLVLGCG